MPLQLLALGWRMAAVGQCRRACRRVAMQTVTGNLPALKHRCGHSSPGIGWERATHHARGIIGLRRLRSSPLLSRVQQEQPPVAFFGGKNADAGGRNLDPVDGVRVHPYAVCDQTPQHIPVAYERHQPSSQLRSAPHLLQDSQASSHDLRHGFTAGNSGRASPLVEVAPSWQAVQVGKGSAGPVTEIHLVEPFVFKNWKAKSRGQRLCSLHGTVQRA